MTQELLSHQRMRVCELEQDGPLPATPHLSVLQSGLLAVTLFRMVVKSSCEVVEKGI